MRKIEITVHDENPQNQVLEATDNDGQFVKISGPCTEFNDEPGADVLAYESRLHGDTTAKTGTITGWDKAWKEIGFHFGIHLSMYTSPESEIA